VRASRSVTGSEGDVYPNTVVDPDFGSRVAGSGFGCGFRVLSFRVRVHPQPESHLVFVVQALA
jgi:hypothetical protein